MLELLQAPARSDTSTTSQAVLPEVLRPAPSAVSDLPAEPIMAEHQHSGPYGLLETEEEGNETEAHDRAVAEAAQASARREQVTLAFKLGFCEQI